MISSSWKKHRKYIMWVCISVLYLLCFKLVLDSGYVYDDMWTHVERGMVINEGISFKDMLLSGWHHWIFEVGRIMIFSYYCGFVVNFFPLILYKLMIVTAILLDALLLSLIIKELTGSRKLMYLTVVIFPTIVSLCTTYFSAMYGFHALVQITMLFVLSGVYFYIIYRRTKKIRYQVLSCLFWFISLGIYELSYVLCVCFIIALLCIDGWEYIRKHPIKSIKTGLPQIIIMLVWLVANLYFRQIAIIKYSGSTANFNIGTIGVTFLKQCSSAFGVGVSLVNMLSYDKGYWLEFIRDYVGIVQIVTYILLFTAILLVLLKIKNNKIEKPLGIVAFGATLIVMPGLIIGVSSRYQEELSWFTGYIPAYMQSWGVAIILSVMIIEIGSLFKDKTKKYAIYSVIMAFICTLIYIFNSIVGANTVKDVNGFYQDHYNTMQDSIDAGLLDDVGLDYVLDTAYAPYNVDANNTSRAYATMMLSKCNIVGWDDILLPDNIEDYDEEDIEGIKTNASNIKMSNLEVLSHSSKEYALIAKCDSYNVSKAAYGYNYNVYVSSMNIFIYNDISKKIICTDSDGREIIIDLSTSELVKKGKKGNIYHIDFDNNIDISTIEIDK